MPVVSALVRTFLDQVGNRFTEGWITLELTGAYTVGGQAFDLSPYYRRIEHINAELMSGGQLRAPASGAGVYSGVAFQSGSWVQPMPVFEDYGTPASTRFQLLGVPASIIATSGQRQTDAVGGYQEIGSGALAAAVSGVRFLAKVLGY